jgi:hypothetical protein
VRFTKWLLLALGVLFIVLGAIGMLWAVSAESYLAMGLGSAAAAFIFVGVVMFLAARYVGRLDPTATLEHGIAGTAQVRGVRDTGVIVNNRNLVVEVDLVVQLPDRAPYETTTKVPLGRTQWGAIQPGMTLPVKVDPHDPERVVVDPSRSVVSGAGTGVGGTPLGGVQTTTVSAAAIVASGTPAVARLLAVEPVGLTAGAVAPGLPAEQADDPVVKVAFSYRPAGGDEVHVEHLVRVPDGKAGFLAAGRDVPVRYLPDSPSTATIDFDRLV